MKKLMVVLMMSMMFLVGCSGSGPAQTVATMYKAAMDQDTETFVKIFANFEDDIRGYEDEAMEDLASMVFDVGGVSKMKIAEVSKNKLIDEAVEGLTDLYGNNWHVVSVDFGEDEYFVWVLQEIDGKFYVVSGDDLSADEFLK